MKRSLFALSFTSAQLLFIFLHIHKHNQFIRHSFRKQKNERTLAALQSKQQELEQVLCSLQNKSVILQFAQRELHMRPISLQQVKRVPHVSAS